MTDKKSNDSRRKLLKSIAAGSGAIVAGKSLPESWSKPVVNAVMLPAHAATTETTTTSTPCPECDELYCYDFNAGTSPTDIFLSIIVDGESIRVLVQTTGGEANGEGTANCGAFSISATGGDNPALLVDGVVASDCSEVTGTLTFPISTPHTFKATTGICDR